MVLFNSSPSEKKDDNEALLLYVSGNVVVSFVLAFRSVIDISESAEGEKGRRCRDVFKDLKVELGVMQCLEIEQSGDRDR